MTRCLLYGASGYTGRLLARAACVRGLRPVLAGRSSHKLEPLAAELALPQRTFHLQDPARVAEELSGYSVVLNAAGPFSATAPALIEGCLRVGAHYLDVSGEVQTLAQSALRDSDARRRGVMIMPAVGFEVVPSDCLATFVAGRIPYPTRLSVALSNLSLMSRGSAKTMIALLNEPAWVRRAGELRGIPPGTLARSFDFGAGPRSARVTSWGDVVTAHFSTGIPDITVYFEATSALRIHNSLVQAFGWAIPLTPWQSWLSTLSSYLPEGPSAEERERTNISIVVEAQNDRGQVARARLVTPEAYSLTAETGAAILERVLAGDFEPGFQTPGRVYGADFILRFPGVRRLVE